MHETSTQHENSAGYVYVLTNESMPGKLKVGRTNRHPTQRAQELSSATGVPTPFEVAFYHQFPDSALAEKLVHLELLSGGTNVHRSKEFFTCDVAFAREAVLKIAADTSHENRGSYSTSLRAEAENLLATPRPSTSALNQALACLEFAFQLGDLTAGYFAAKTAYELKCRKGSTSTVGAQLEQLSTKLYLKVAELGVLRAWADLALIHHNSGQEAASIDFWENYFSGLAAGNYPLGEVEHALVLIENNYYLKRAVKTELLFLKNNMAFVRAGKSYFPKNSAYQRWLKIHCYSAVDRFFDKYSLTILFVIGAGILWATRPDLTLLAAVGAAAYLQFFKKKKT